MNASCAFYDVGLHRFSLAVVGLFTHTFLVSFPPLRRLRRRLLFFFFSFRHLAGLPPPALILRGARMSCVGWPQEGNSKSAAEMAAWRLRLPLGCGGRCQGASSPESVISRFATPV